MQIEFLRTGTVNLNVTYPGFYIWAEGLYNFELLYFYAGYTHLRKLQCLP
jgi:hypothetical protein